MLLANIERHDGAPLSPCLHCGAKPHHIVHKALGEVTYSIECPDYYCGVSTGEHPTIDEARQEWETINDETLP